MTDATQEAPMKSGLARIMMGPNARKAMIGVLSVVCGVILWHLASLRTSPLFLPSPLTVAQTTMEMVADGSLFVAIGASAWRISAGWAMGVVLGVPLGLLMGRFHVVRLIVDPYIEFFRFIPPIAFVTLAVIWFGPGEFTKIVLIFYTTVFIVTLNTIAGVSAVNPLRLQAARSMGATKLSEMTTVIFPSAVPFMITGARIAMGNSFLTVVSAEIVSAQTGLGAMIWTARNFGRTDWVFVGIIALGILGYLFDRAFRLATQKWFKRFLF
ncbi:ABC transporter permease [Celeribacter neptunius]|uniref:NitT/TauT family transport system permease protein n=1 Tax=Celeribacter neptunius TaxID=588602 RepID=A0A1I3Y3A4_9RHOB|nr:ABC transporter permease [Celeribacter neptunius]SFK26308.1 NitT/TauT family transport system permease protein [Celeribacter neptunius]